MKITLKGSNWCGNIRTKHGHFKVTTIYKGNASCPSTFMIETDDPQVVKNIEDAMGKAKADKRHEWRAFIGRDKSGNRLYIEYSVYNTVRYGLLDELRLRRV